MMPDWKMIYWLQMHNADGRSFLLSGPVFTLHEVKGVAAQLLIHFSCIIVTFEHGRHLKISLIWMKIEAFKQIFYFIEVADHDFFRCVISYRNYQDK